jgi:hypothetical protein
MDAGAAHVEEKLVAWNAKGDALPQAQVKQALATKFGFDDFEALKEAVKAGDIPDGLEGFTARVVLIGYSYGAQTALDEAAALTAAISDLGMIPDIHVFVVDGVDGTKHPNWKSITTLPNGVDPKNVINYYSNVGRNQSNIFQGAMGAQIQGLPAGNNKPVAGGHLDADNIVLLSDEMEQAVADLEVQEF